MPDAVALNKGLIQAAAIGSGANNDSDIYTGGFDELTVEVDMTGAATGDLVATVLPFEGDNLTVMPIPLTAVRTVGPTLNAGHVYALIQYDVSGIDRVRFRINNANVGAQTITRASWRLS